MDSIRFIHTGDFHLGSPLKTVGNISEGLRKSLMESCYKAIENIVDSAIEYNVDFVLISGDIYDNEARSIKGSRFFASQMERLAKRNIPVFIIYGNHDPMEKGVDFFKLPSNVRVLGSETVEMHVINDKYGKALARILGQSYATPLESRKMYLGFKPPEDELLNIAMLHTGLDPGSNAYIPCSAEELKGQENIHYWALGHIHSPTIVHGGNPIIAYPGIPQGRDVGETGPKGCFLVEIGQENMEVQFIPTSPVIWLTREISINSCLSLDNMDDLVDLLTEEGNKIIGAAPEFPPGFSVIDKDYKPEGYVVRWEISGRNPVHDDLISGNEQEIAETLAESLNRHLASGKPYLWSEGVKLHTGPPIPDLESLMGQDETVKTLYEIKQRLNKDTDFKEKAISAMGNIWYNPRGEGDLRDDTFPVTDEILDSLLEDAFNLAVERIVKEREDY